MKVGSGKEKMTNEIAEVKHNNDEIDLIDLLKIMYKNKIMIVGIFIVTTLLSLGGALYVRANTHDNLAINFSIEDSLDKFYLNKSNLAVKSFDINNMFKNDNIVESFFEQEELKKYYIKNGGEEALTKKREFLEDIIKLSLVEDKTYYQLSITEAEGLDVQKLMEIYIATLNNELYTNYNIAIENKYEDIKAKRNLYEGELEKINEKVNTAIEGEPANLFNNENAVAILQLKYPMLFTKQREASELYRKYESEQTGIEGLLEDRALKDQVRELSSYYEIKQKSKAKLILALGIVLGMIFGVMGAFLKEFWSYFKDEVRK